MPEARGLRRGTVVRATTIREGQHLRDRTSTLERGHGPLSANQQVSEEESTS